MHYALWDPNSYNNRSKAQKTVLAEGHVLYKLVLYVNQCTAITSRNSKYSTQTKFYERGLWDEPRGN